MIGVVTYAPPTLQHYLRLRLWELELIQHLRNSVGFENVLRNDPNDFVSAHILCAYEPRPNENIRRIVELQRCNHRRSVYAHHPLSKNRSNHAQSRRDHLKPTVNIR